MICPNCNKEIDNDSRFCRHCGVEFIDEKETVIEISPYDDISEDESPETTEYEAINPIKNTKNKKTLKLQIFITLIVLIIAGSVFAIVAKQTGFFSPSKEIVTDADGEKIRPGRGTTEMSVQDIDGTVRTITTDRSLLTAEKILDKYTVLMNKLKDDSPAFSFIRYQNLPTDYQNVGAAAKFVLPIIEKYVTSKSASKSTQFESGNSEKLPLPDSAYGCLLTDSTAIKNAYCEVLDDGTYKIVMTINDELNPPVLSSGATSSQSIINAVFDTYDALNQITAISELAFNKIDFNYTDCTATVIYNPDTEQVQSINMLMNIDIVANTLLGELKARIVDICEYEITY